MSRPLSIISSNACTRCGKAVADLSVRFCPDCGQPLFVDLSRSDLRPDDFLDVLNSLYNLIIIIGHKQRDAHFHPVSRRLMNARFELEHREEFGALMFGSLGVGETRFPGRLEAIGMRVSARSSNAVTGYAVRACEELIVRRKLPPLPIKTIQEGIDFVGTQYKDEYIVKRIAKDMPSDADRQRIMFIFYLQDDNRHVNYFLDESMIEKHFGTVLGQNVELTLQKHREAISVAGIRRTFKEDELAEEVLSDIVFGYCLKLSESLFPIEEALL